MNDRRTYLLIVLSLLLHLGILWLLPAPDFEADRPEDERSLRVSLLDRERPRRDAGEQSPRQEDVRTEESAPEEQSPDPETEPDEAPDEGSEPAPEQQPEPPEREEPSPDREPSESRTEETPDRPDETEESRESEQAEEAVPEEEGEEEPAAREENDTGDEPNYDLLAGGPGSSGSGDASAPTVEEDEESGTAGTALANREVEQFEVVETFESENRRGDTVSIEVPDEENDTPGVVEAPAYTVSRASPDPSALGDTDDRADDYRQPTLPSGGREILRQPLPTVPDWLEETGEEVRVIVRYDIDRDGEVSSLEVVTSSGYSDLDTRVVEKARQWRFEPGPRSERRLAVFRFVLE